VDGMVGRVARRRRGGGRWREGRRLWRRLLLRLRRRDENHDDEGGEGRLERCCPHWDVLRNQLPVTSRQIGLTRTCGCHVPGIGETDSRKLEPRRLANYFRCALVAANHFHR